MDKKNKWKRRFLFALPVWFVYFFGYTIPQFGLSDYLPSLIGEVIGSYFFCFVLVIFLDFLRVKVKSKIRKK